MLEQIYPQSVRKKPLPARKFPQPCANPKTITNPSPKTCLNHLQSPKTLEKRKFGGGLTGLGVQMARNWTGTSCSGDASAETSFIWCDTIYSGCMYTGQVGLEVRLCRPLQAILFVCFFVSRSFVGLRDMNARQGSCNTLIEGVPLLTRHTMAAPTAKQDVQAMIAASCLNHIPLGSCVRAQCIMHACSILYIYMHA